MCFHSWPGTRSVVTAIPVALMIKRDLQPEGRWLNMLTASKTRLTAISVGYREFCDVTEVVFETTGKLRAAAPWTSQNRSGSALERGLTFPLGCAN